MFDISQTNTNVFIILSAIKKGKFQVTSIVIGRISVFVAMLFLLQLMETASNVRQLKNK